jgi:hypothetical protein
MTIGSIITSNPTVTATGAVTTTTGLDISGITGDYTVHLRILALSAASGTPNVAIQLEDSVNAFTALVSRSGGAAVYRHCRQQVGTAFLVAQVPACRNCARGRPRPCSAPT